MEKILLQNFEPLQKKFTKQIADGNFKATIVAKVDFILELFWRLI